MIKQLWILSLLLALLTVSCRSFTKNTSDVSDTGLSINNTELVQLAKNLGVSAEDILLIVEQETKKLNENIAPNIWVLNTSSVLDITGITLGAIKGTIERRIQAHREVGVGAGLAAAGVLCMLVPMPGVQGVAMLVLIKGATIVGGVVATYQGSRGTYYATKAGTAVQININELKDAVKAVLNRLILSNPKLKLKIGEVTDILLDKNFGINYFLTSQNYAFASHHDLATGGFCFVSVKYQTLFKTYEQDLDSVISLIDGSLLDKEDYFEYSKHLSCSLQKSRSGCQDFIGNDNVDFAKNYFKTFVDGMGYFANQVNNYLIAWPRYSSKCVNMSEDECRAKWKLDKVYTEELYNSYISFKSKIEHSSSSFSSTKSVLDEGYSIYSKIGISREFLLQAAN